MDQKPFAASQPAAAEGETVRAIPPSAVGTAVASPPPSRAETAQERFQNEVGRLPGVLRVEQWGGEGLGAPTFHVYVRSGDRDTEYAVYEVKGQVYDCYPEAYLDVIVLEALDELPANCARSS